VTLVWVVDDDDGVRRGLELLLGSAGLAVTSYGDAESFLAGFDPACPGCIIADLQMPGLSGLDVQQRLLARGVTTPVLFLTGHGDVPAAVQALKLGAHDFIQKPVAGEQLLEAVTKAIAADAEQRRIAARAARAEALLDRLSPREREVLGRVCAGQANKVVALELGISERTVELHRSRLMRKLEVRSLAELLALQAEAESTP
jgi:two-component system, LuxR family, response regulator FixJ